MRIDNFYQLKDLTLIEHQFSQISDGEMFTSLGGDMRIISTEGFNALPPCSCISTILALYDMSKLAVSNPCQLTTDILSRVFHPLRELRLLEVLDNLCERMKLYRARPGPEFPYIKGGLWPSYFIRTKFQRYFVQYLEKKIWREP